MGRPRHLLAVAVLMPAGCGATGGGDRPDRDATLLLDGPPAAVHAGIASAAARGYDEAEGVHLRIRTPTPRTDAARALEHADADFAVMDLHELARHRDLVAVMAIVQRPLLALVARGPDALPKTPWSPALLAALHGEGLARWDLLAPGAAPRRVEEAGEPLYPELVLVVPRETIADEPAIIRATVAALARGYRFALGDPASSAEDLRSRLGVTDAGPQLDRLDTAFLGDAARPGVLDVDQIAAWRRWAAAHGL